MFHGIWSQFRDNPDYDEIISAGARSAMTDEEFLATATKKWLHSPPQDAAEGKRMVSLRFRP